MKKEIKFLLQIALVVCAIYAVMGFFEIITITETLQYDLKATGIGSVMSGVFRKKLYGKSILATVLSFLALALLILSFIPFKIKIGKVKLNWIFSCLALVIIIVSICLSFKVWEVPLYKGTEGTKNYYDVTFFEIYIDAFYSVTVPLFIASIISVVFSGYDFVLLKKGGAVEKQEATIDNEDIKKQELLKYQKLLEAGAISKEEYDKAVNEL